MKEARERLDYNNDSIIRAEAAQYVYRVDEYNRGAISSLPEAPEGLNIIDTTKIAGLENTVFTSKETGFGAALFNSEINGETLLTYRATNNAVTGKKIGGSTFHKVQALKLKHIHNLWN